MTINLNYFSKFSMDGILELLNTANFTQCDSVITESSCRKLISFRNHIRHSWRDLGVENRRTIFENALKTICGQG